MNKKNLIASIVEGNTLCIFEDLMENETFKEMFHLYSKTKSIDEAGDLLTQYVNEEMA